MAKLKLVANPTFSAPVPIPVAGGDPVNVSMSFRHRTKTELNEWTKAREGKEDADSFLEMVVAWELDDAFTRENVVQFLEIYGGAAVATYRTYVAELIGAREKN